MSNAIADYAVEFVCLRVLIHICNKLFVATSSGEQIVLRKLAAVTLMSAN